ncbi:MAG: deoxyribonuclease IV [Candidatus Omnitrophica bacterium]|nr:deoxyribonuclease IV [Candidatus Omnitrophota bacterium]MCM8802293.1 deoxyribonuclease IV [Candidatus Omnitrophota bacterium]
MQIGAHLWIGEGLEKVIEFCEYLKSNCFQIFLSNPRSWKRKIRKEQEIEKFKQGIKKRKIKPVVIHMPYILNIAESDIKEKKKIINLLEKELEESEKMNADFYVIHPGFHKGQGEKKGIENVIDLLKSLSKSNIKILVENTSGQGTSLGYKFEHFYTIFEKIDKNLGICFDTAHAFQSGYNLKKFDEVKKDIEKFIPLSYILLIHANDSKTALNSKKDRHEHIGKGEIGIKGFEQIIKDDYFGNLPFIIETPKVSLKEDRRNIEIIKKIGEEYGKI